MNTTRTGKIARLPKAIRDELNQRLVDGESASEILAWLHELKDVEAVLFKYFNCRPITAQNLSEWRHGGHQDWLREQQTLAFAGQLVERSQNLAEQSGHQRLPDHFATLLATEFIKLAETMLDEHQDSKQRWACLGEIQDRLSRLRRDDHRAIHASILHQRYTRQFKAEDEAAAQAADQEERRQHVVRFRIWRGGVLRDEAKFYGGGDLAHDIAAMSLEEQHNLEFGLLGRHSEDFALKRDPDEHKYPWRRPWKKRTPQTPEDKNDAPTAEATPTPTTSDPSDRSDTSDTPPIAEPPLPPDAIPLANDCPPAETAADSSPGQSRTSPSPQPAACRRSHRSPASPETLHRPTPPSEDPQNLPEKPGIKAN